MYSDKATQIADLYVEYCYEQVRLKNQKKLDFIEKKRQERQKKRHMLYVVAFGVIVIFISILFLHYEFKIESDMQRIEKLQVKITSMQDSNMDTQKRLNQRTNYTQIQQQAFYYGMHYPSSDEIVFYEPVEKDYMLQTNNIPN